LVATGTHAETTEVLNPPTKTAAKKKSKKLKKSASPANGKAKFMAGSQETKKELDARLTRECKGEVNAGACAGYAR
jgi:hypothetical protein